MLKEIKKAEKTAVIIPEKRFKELCSMIDILIGMIEKSDNFFERAYLNSAKEWKKQLDEVCNKEWGDKNPLLNKMKNALIYN